LFQSMSALETGIFQARITSLTFHVNIVLLICTLVLATTWTVKQSDEWRGRH